jgi:pimeloyl-ACP methyl ester carboxylesterase
VNEQFAPVGDGIKLCYETFGDPADPTVLLVMGLATQMIAWDTEFCDMLVQRGFHVVRYDNRDCGRSSRAKGRPPTLKQLIVRDKSAASYTISDLARDGIRLLDHLGVQRAHVVGASMGGMIAQTMAIEYPHRVLSLCSIMSNTGGRWSGQPAFTILPLFLRRPPRDREGYADHILTLFSKIGSSGFTRDEERTRANARQAYDRGLSAAGSGRQIAAILAAEDRTEALGGLRIPTLVIHGTADRLVGLSGGRATAKAIPGAELMLIEGMGHDLPEQTFERIVEGIVRNARRAGADTPSSAAA